MARLLTHWPVLPLLTLIAVACQGLLGKGGALDRARRYWGNQPVSQASTQTKESEVFTCAWHW